MACRWRGSNSHEQSSTVFLTTSYCYDRKMRCGLDYVFTISFFDLGSEYIVSTHLGLLHLVRRCLLESFTELARFYIEVSYLCTQFPETVAYANSATPANDKSIISHYLLICQVTTNSNNRQSLHPTCRLRQT